MLIVIPDTDRESIFKETIARAQNLILRSFFVCSQGF